MNGMEAVKLPHFDRDLYWFEVIDEATNKSFRPEFAVDSFGLAQKIAKAWASQRNGTPVVYRLAEAQIERNRFVDNPWKWEELVGQDFSAEAAFISRISPKARKRLKV